MVSDRAGVSDFVKVLDFGLATVLGPQGGTGEIKIAGTIRYMAPECFLTPQEIGPASDVYSMGAMLYELLGETQLVPLPIRETGSVTAWAERLENLALALPEKDSAPTWNRLRVLSLVSMAVNPQARPGDANEFLRQLKSIRDGADD